MLEDDRTGWDCRFCREKLKQQSLTGWRRLFWIFPVRTFRCPHCFNTFRKPVVVIASIPVVGPLFCEKRGVSASVSRLWSKPLVRRKKRSRNYITVGWFVRFARWTGRIDSNLSQTIGRLFRACLWPLHLFSKKFLTTSQNSLRSGRSKSRKRSSSSRSDNA